MKRETSPIRTDFKEQAEKIGFAFSHIDGQPYWDESARYRFSLRQIEDHLERATLELGALFRDLVGRVIASEAMMDRLGIPVQAHDAVAESWRRRDLSLYGRFDFAYDGENPPKLLEYNADTPTSLFESAVVQWFWLEQMVESGALPGNADQFNSLHERLIDRWRRIAEKHLVHFACVTGSVEDRGTTAYLEDCARQAGAATALIDMSDIGLGPGGFVDRSGRAIERMFKLYPWEWMFDEEFGKAPALKQARWIEPAWKMPLSNKGMLALAWELAPGHPNLLPCFFDDDPRAASLGENYAVKPQLSREGGNVELHCDGAVIRGPDLAYGGGKIRQALRLLPDFGGNRPVLGCWLVGDEPAGMGVREDVSPVTGDRSRFVPHYILD